MSSPDTVFEVFELSTTTAVYGSVVVVTALTLLVHRFWRYKTKTTTTASTTMVRGNKKKLAEEGIVSPPHVSRWIPYLGSAIDLVMGDTPPLDFMFSMSEKVSSPVFTATIAGKKCAFLTDSRMVPLLFANNSDAWDREAPQIDALHKAMGCDRQDAQQFYSQMHKSIHKYLLNTNMLEEALPKVQTLLAREIEHDLGSCTGTNNDDWKNIELMRFVADHMYVVSTETFLSPTVSSREFMPAFDDLNKGFPLAFSGLPKALLPKYRAAVDKFMHLISQPEYLETGSELVKLMSGLEASEDTIQRANVLVLWASVGNSLAAMFWVLYYILKDQNGAFESLRREADRVMGDSKEPLTLEQLDQLVEAKSAFQEALRLQSGAFHVRDLLKDYVVAPKMTNAEETTGRPTKFLLKKGTRIMGYAVNNWDEAIFEKPYEFHWKRFAPDENGVRPSFTDRNGKPLLTPSLPFGAGSHGCPGRKFIVYEGAAYIAMLVKSFDMRLVSTHYPGVEKESVGMGILVPDKDVTIQLRKRA